MQGVTYNYDSKFDILYVAVADKSQSYGDDAAPGLIIMRDMITDVATGFTIFGFRQKLTQNRLPALPPDLSICLKRDVIPRVRFS